MAMLPMAVPLIITQLHYYTSPVADQLVPFVVAITLATRSVIEPPLVVVVSHNIIAIELDFDLLIGLALGGRQCWFECLRSSMATTLPINHVPAQFLS